MERGLEIWQRARMLAALAGDRKTLAVAGHPRQDHDLLDARRGPRRPGRGPYLPHRRHIQGPGKQRRFRRRAVLRGGGRRDRRLLPVPVSLRGHGHERRGGPSRLLRRHRAGGARRSSSSWRVSCPGGMAVVCADDARLARLARLVRLPRDHVRTRRRRRRAAPFHRASRPGHRATRWPCPTGPRSAPRCPCRARTWWTTPWACSRWSRRSASTRRWLHAAWSRSPAYAGASTPSARSTGCASWTTTPTIPPRWPPRSRGRARADSAACGRCSSRIATAAPRVSPPSSAVLSATPTTWCSWTCTRRGRRRSPGCRA